MKNNDKDLLQAAEEVADKMYDPSFYKSESLTEQGLAITHEQVSDDYMEGTNDGKIDENAGQKNIEIPRTGYENMF
ncbi:YozQ family protein [Brevibacillus porteri]|uniref:YozQ family protein n=1 Tax=Brevibacillus porteri TaxID=2126350 RepID=UPI003D1C2304